MSFQIYEKYQVDDEFTINSAIKMLSSFETRHNKYAMI